MSSSPIQLIAGLGNPGKKYAKSRHNAGAWLVEVLAERASLRLKTEGVFQGITAKLDQEKCWLLVPSTAMNDSGRSVSALAGFYRLPTEAILVVHDDLDLPPGIARFKQGGGHGGHNGVKDIVAHLDNQNFWRLRIGIGHPGHRDEVHRYVLSPPSLPDRQKIDESIQHAIASLIPFVHGERQRSIQTLHQFKTEEESE